MKNKVFVLSLLLMTFSLKADITLPCVLSDNMMLQQSADVRIWGWAHAGEQISIKAGWADGTFKTQTDKDGKWEVKIKTLKAGGPYSMKVAGKNEITIKNILIGEVWLCSGQSNMAMPMNGYSNGQHIEGGPEDIANSANKSIRLFRVASNPHPEFDDIGGCWTECTPQTVAEFSAAGYYFAREVNARTNLPVGMMMAAVGGSPCEAWTKHEAMANDEQLSGLITLYDEENRKWQAECDKAKLEGKPEPKIAYRFSGNFEPSRHYNRLIKPLTPMTIKGVIWYQGEANRGRGLEYRKLFPAMIDSWRCDFENYDMPFYFVQLPMFDSGSMPEIREAQLFAGKLKNNAMAVTIDLGDHKRIHPAYKEPVGQRLAYIALANDYGQDVEFSGPLYKGYFLEGDKIRIAFDHANGMKAIANHDTAFMIAGEDRVFYPAKFTICDSFVVVSSDKVAAPVSVRYGWDVKFDGCLVNDAALPASPFRTDDWDLSSSTVAK